MTAPSADCAPVRAAKRTCEANFSHWTGLRAKSGPRRTRSKASPRGGVPTGKIGSLAGLDPRPDDRTYGCDACQRCGARWEIRRCKSCDEHFPVLRPDPMPRPGDLDGDALDRVFGSELLAAPCWLRPSACVCPSCGMCAEAAAGNANGCGRCDGSLYSR